jgi:hypothetical protein
MAKTVCAIVSTETQLTVTLQHDISVWNITKPPHVICMAEDVLAHRGRRRNFQQIVVRS